MTCELLAVALTLFSATSGISAEDVADASFASTTCGASTWSIPWASTPARRAELEACGRPPEARSLAQSAYQVIVAPSEALLADDKETLWDSGKVGSDQSLHVAYGGKALASHASCWWKVRVWDQDSKVSAWSVPARWTMGMLDAKDWSARWIGWDGGEETEDQTARDRLPRGSGTQGESPRSVHRSAPVTSAGR